ncbi:hypothetical protein IWZ00DRAFT_570189 [Phyllosticta capitalensis]
MPSSMLQQIVAASALSATSNVLAQFMTAQKQGQPKSSQTSCSPSARTRATASTDRISRSQQPLVFDFAAFVKFVLCTVISTPPNVLWQEYLEEAYPGNTPPPSQNKDKEKSGKTKDEKSKQKRSNGAGPVVDEGERNYWNMFMKFFLDQTVGAFVNIVLFVATIRALNGSGSDEIIAAIKESMWPIYSAGLKLWPLVSLISFSVVPVDKRVVFGSIVGVAWGVYLSLVAAES